MGPQSKDRAKTTPAVMCVKILLHIFNLLYLIIGVCVLAVGIWTQIELKEYMKITGLYYDNTAYIMIGVGSLILLVSIGGFYCTARDKIALLYMYAVFISLLAIFEIGAGIAGAVYSKKIDSAFTTGLAKSFNSSDGNVKKAWDKVQSTVHCCGIESYKDWKDDIPSSCYEDGKKSSGSSGTSSSTTTSAAPSTTTSAAPPTTASTTPSTTSPTTPSTTTSTTPPTTSTPSIAPTEESGSRRKRSTDLGPDGVFKDGCHKLVVDKVTGFMGIIIGICVGFVVLQILGAVLACCLARKTSKNNYEQIY